MKRILKKTAAAAAALVLAAYVYAPAVYGIRDYDETAQDLPAFSAAAHRAQPSQTENTLIVKTNGTLPDFRALHPQQTVQGPDDMYTVTFSTAQEAADKLPDVCALHGVEYAEPNVRVYAQGAGSGYLTYGMELMKAERFAADLSKRDDLQPVVVAVVDSGVKADKAVFAGRLTEGASMNGMSETEDVYGHGTCVAGVVADCTRGLPVQIMSVRVLGPDGSGSLLDAANGVKYAAEHGAAIVNLSFVAEVCSQTLHDAVDSAVAYGSLPVICTGNSALDMDKKASCPADYSRGFVVSGCDQKTDYYKKSCYGSTVDMCAPAVDVSCYGVYSPTQTMSGTSFAAPHISAIAAMYKLYVPDADRAVLEKWLTLNTKDLGDTGFDTRFGWGLPDLSALDGTQTRSAAAKIRNVEISRAPDKTTYYYKEQFSPEGLRVRVTYSDGVTEERTTQGVQLLGADSLKPGTNTIRAVFDGHEAAFDVTVRYKWWQWIIRIFLFGWIWY